MSNNDSALMRLLIFLLGGALIAAAFLVVQINPFEVGLTYLALLAGVAAVGLLTNVWGGLLASAVGTFAVIIINQYVGVYPRENYVLNIASELAVFLTVGPLAGAVAVLLERLQQRTEHWQKIAEERTVHDEVLGTLNSNGPKYALKKRCCALCDSNARCQ
jgi:K+-sensing histidine kinase KdpD